ncbi:MAG: PEFG-CTERM sorting domain-containing protein, partial [Nitrosopumilaceae archaeon]
MKQIRNSFFLVFALASLTVLGFSLNAYAQFQDLSCPSCVQISEDEIELYKSLFPLITWTDEVLYDHDSIVILEGYLRPELVFNPVTITVTNPIGNIVTIEQITPNSDGSFIVEFNTSSNLWASNGEYIIKSQSGSDRIFKNKIELTSLNVGKSFQCKLTEITVTADNGGQYCVPYTATGETTGVDGNVNIETKTLTLDIRGKGIETITIELPRYLLDSKLNGQDSDFIILFNGQPTTF